jgi:hypothetical protein
MYEVHGLVKTDEQVLKEWALDRIEFQFDRRRYFTKAEFRVLAGTLFFATIGVNLLRNKIKSKGEVGQKVCDLVISNEDNDMLVEVRKKIKQPRFKHLRGIDQLVRFASLDDLYDHVTSRGKREEF